MATHTVFLDDEELNLVRSALQSYLKDFGHDEGEILRATKHVIEKLPQPGDQPAREGRYTTAL